MDFSRSQQYAKNEDATAGASADKILFDNTQRQTAGTTTVDWNKISEDYRSKKISTSDIIALNGQETNRIAQQTALAESNKPKPPAPPPKPTWGDTAGDMLRAVPAAAGNLIGNNLTGIADVKQFINDHVNNPFGELNGLIGGGDKVSKKGLGGLITGQDASPVVDPSVGGVFNDLTKTLNPVSGSNLVTGLMRNAGSAIRSQMYDPTTTAGKVTEGVTRFIGEFAGLSKVTATPKIIAGSWKARSGISGAAGFFETDPTKATDFMANSITENMDAGTAKEFLTYLAQNPNDPAVLNRTRLALQETVGAVLAEGLIKVGKVAWNAKFGRNPKALETLTTEVEKKFSEKAGVTVTEFGGREVKPLNPTVTEVTQSIHAKDMRQRSLESTFNADLPVTPRSTLPNHAEVSHAVAVKQAADDALLSKINGKSHQWVDHTAVEQASKSLEEILGHSVAPVENAGTKWIAAQQALDTPAHLRTAEDLLSLAEHDKHLPDIILPDRNPIALPDSPPLSAGTGKAALTDVERARALDAPLPVNKAERDAYVTKRITEASANYTKVNDIVIKVEKGTKALSDTERQTLLNEVADNVFAIASTAGKRRSQFPSLVMDGTLKADGTIDFAKLLAARGEKNPSVLKAVGDLALGSTKAEIKANLGSSLFGAGAAMADDKDGKGMSGGEMALTALLFGLGGRFAVKAYFKGTPVLKSLLTKEAESATAHEATVQAATAEARKLPESISPLHEATAGIRKALPRIAQIDAEGIARSMAAGDHVGVAAKLRQSNPELFNMKNIDSDEGIRDIIAHFGETFNAQTLRATGGVQTNEMTEKLAQELGTSSQDLKKLYGEDTAQLAARVTANRILLSASTQHVADLLEAYAKAGIDDVPAALIALRKQSEIHNGIQLAMKGVQTEIGRALQAFRIKAYGNELVLNKTDELLNGLGGRELNQEFAKELRDIFASGDNVGANRFMRQTSGANKMDMLKTAWYASVLSGLQTHAANIASNIGKLVEGSFENTMAVGLGKLAGTKGAEHYVATDYLKGQLLGAKIAIGMADKEFGESTVKQAFMTNLPILDSASALKIDGRVTNASISSISSTAQGVTSDSAYGKILDLSGKYLFSAPSRALVAEDEFFKSSNYFGKLMLEASARGRSKGLVAEELDKYINGQLLEPDHDLLEQAIAAAREGTFTQGLGDTATKVNSALQSSGGWLILPFMRTSVNITKSFAERVPVLGALMENNKAMWAAGGMQRNLMLAKQATGALYITGAMSLGSLTNADGTDVLVGGGIFESRQDAEKLANVQPYSVHLGDQYYGYNRITPIGWFVGLVADWHNYSAHMTEYERVTVSSAALTIFSKFLESQTFLQGVSHLVTMLDDQSKHPDSKAAQKWLGQTLSPVVPNIIASNNRAYEDTEMKEFWGVMDKIKERIPMVSNSVLPSRSLFGEAQHYEGGLGIDAISPIYTRTANPSIASKEMYRLNVDIQKPTKRFGNVDLTANEYDSYMKSFGTYTMRGKTLQEALIDRIKKPDWTDKEGHIVPVSEGGLSEHQANYTGRKEQIIRGIYAMYKAGVDREFKLHNPALAKEVSIDNANKGAASLGLPITPLSQPYNPYDNRDGTVEPQ